MTSFSSNVSLTRGGEFFARFGRCGGTMKMLKRLNGDGELMAWLVNQLRTRPEFALVHGVFTKTDDILTNFQARCVEKGIEFTKFSWIGSQTPPEFTDDHEVVVVLDATLDTLQNTFEFAWAWTVDGQDDSWRWDGVLSGSQHLRLLSDERSLDAEGDHSSFLPWTLSWRKIKLNTNIGKCSKDVRNPETSLGCALLWMSAEHPERIKAIEYKARFGFWIAGLKNTAPGGEPFADVPYVSFRRDDRRVGLGANPADRSNDNLAVPSLQE